MKISIPGVVAFAAALLASTTVMTAQAQASVTPAEARAIAKEAYIYGFPMVDHYRIQYSYFQDKSDPNYKTSWNELINIPRVYTPADTAIQTPNSDTPYSFIGMDLRAEPLVLTVPKIEKKRYFTIQLIDAYTHNFAYVGSRTTGNDGGSFLIAGPNWKGETPKGIKQVIRSETQFVFGALPHSALQPGRHGEREEDPGRLQGTAALRISRSARARCGAGHRFHQAAHGRSAEDISRVLQHPEFRPAVLPDASVREGTDGALRQDRRWREARPSTRASFRPKCGRPLNRAWPMHLAELAALQKRIDAKEVTSGQMFGTREYLENNYLYRMAAAVNGIYGNSEAEAIYPLLALDDEGQKPDGSKKYILRFAPGSTAASQCVLVDDHVPDAGDPARR